MKSTTPVPGAPAAGDRRHTPGTRSRRARALPLAAVAGGAVLSLVLAACGGSSNSGGGSSASGGVKAGATLTIADVAPFSGPDAALGPTYLATCYGATHVINGYGGVLGHKFTCKSVDTRGEPADAVPAVNQLFASTSNVALVIGCTSDEAASVVPVINARHTVMFCMTGQSEFDHVHFPYFYRLVPPDLEEAYAMVVIAQRLHYSKLALAFGNDIGSQTFVQPAIGAIKKAGMTVTTSQTLALNASTFRTEAEAIIQSHPQAILTEALGTADPTLFAEIKQLNHGKPIPIIATSAAISPPFFKAAASALGASTFASNFHADNLVTETSGPAYGPFKNALLSQQGKVPGTVGNFTTYLSAPGGVHLYDGINLAALAMLKAKSVVPSVYSKDIAAIGDGTPGATVCYSFVQCAGLLKSGKSIRYEGPGGPTSFDAYHDSTGIFQIDTYSPSGAVNVVGNISAAELRAVQP
jgi:ABC-type branched-subunit amino acid transport system substrate-binding protein